MTRCCSSDKSKEKESLFFLFLSLSFGFCVLFLFLVFSRFREIPGFAFVKQIRVSLMVICCSNREQMGGVTDPLLGRRRFRQMCIYIFYLVLFYLVSFLFLFPGW